MPDSGTNVRFQVLLNGEVVATAGLSSYGVLSIICDWVRRDLDEVPEAKRSAPGFNPADWIGDRVRMRVGALDSARDEHLEWFGSRLNAGDQVTIKILPPGEFDPPAGVIPRDYEDDEEPPDHVN
jgi:hypothetical protein